MLGQHHYATTLLRRLRTPSFLTVLVVALGAVHAHASEWILNESGDYSAPANWSAGVPNGADATADFSTLDISADVLFSLNTDITLGHLLFGDADLSTAGTLALDNADGAFPVITLDAASKPTISAGALSPLATFDDTFLGVVLAGTEGFRKLGPGILSLEALNHTLTGPVDIEEGTLKLGDGITFGAESPITFYDGATLDSDKPLHEFPSYNVVSGATGNLISRRASGAVNLRHLMGPGTGEGAGINLSTGAEGAARLQLQSSDTGGLDSWTVTNLDSINTFWLRMMLNNGGNSLNKNVWADAAVTLNGINASGRTNSGGNDVSIGSLAGDALSGLSGGASGTSQRWHIGSLNTDTEFAGVIQHDKGGSGMAIEKVGTGTLTFSGSQNTTMSADNADISLTGGVVRVSEGTLALTNTFDHFVGGTSTTLTTIDVNEGAFFDVSDTNNTYYSSDMQQLQGSGTIIGNYINAAATDPNFSAGIILPGNGSAPGTRTNFTNKTVPTAGTLTFDGDLQLNGGSIGYDVSGDPNTGNDLIHVIGTTALNAGTIFINTVEGGQLGQDMTVIRSDGGFTGNPSNLSAVFAGRGTASAPIIDGNDLILPAIDASSANLTWVGTPGTWDIETSANWDNGGSADVYFDGDNVTFDATGNHDVSVEAVVSPSSIVISSENFYAFTGSGSIQGAGSLTVNDAFVKMHLQNGFTGDATINNSFGLVDIGNKTGALGRGDLLINGDVLIDSDGWASGDKGALDNSSITVPAGSKFTMQVHSGRNRSGAFFLKDITGAGDVELAVSHNQKYYRPIFTGFTGNLTVLPFGAASVTGLRLNENALILPDSVVTLVGAIVQMGDSVNNALIEFGELHGDAGTVLAAAETGNPGPLGWNTTYRIGALGTDSDFAGIIQDDGYDAPGCCTAALSHLTKVGAGTLTLTRAHMNTYTGDTTVEAGTLSIDAVYLADTADVLLTGDATLNLDFVGTDTINALFIAGDSQVPGTWGAVGSGAANETTLITGTGLLQVTAN